MTGQDVDDFKAYVVFDCESNDRAEAVKGVFEALKEGAGGEVNPSENPLQFGLRMVTSEEGELPFAVNLDSSVHGSSVVLKVTLQDE